MPLIQVTVYGTGGAEESVTVTQAGSSTTIDVSPENQPVSSSAGSTYFDVTANAEWSVSDDASWLTATKTSDNRIDCTYSSNPNTTSRTATITAYCDGGVDDKVIVTQAGQ